MAIAVKRRGKSRGPEAAEARLAFWLILPAVIGMVAVSLYPVLQTIAWAFQHYQLTDPENVYFNGFHNFQRLAGDPNFWAGLRFSLLYTVLSVAGQFVVGFVFALTAHREFRGRGIVRAAMLFPWTMPTVITAVVWRFMYNPDSTGLFNGTLEHLGLPHNIVWLGSSATLAVIALLILAVWKVNSFCALVVLAGLQSIPGDVYEAASVDGAGALRQFFSITLPYLRQTIMVVLVLRTVESLQAFDIIVGLTNGGPGNATLNLPLYIFQKGLSGAQDFGLSSATALVLFAIILVFAIVYTRVLYREETFA
ncbi:MAG: ABC transporter permease [Candidatus Nephthysia bennettiae]|nr:MAG: ABC transporter permease [Candidatus Dormibacteraeota bacterium]